MTTFSCKLFWLLVVMLPCKFIGIKPFFHSSKDFILSLMKAINFCVCNKNTIIVSSVKSIVLHCKLMWFLVKIQVENVIKHMFWDAQFSRYMLPSGVLTCFSPVLFVMKRSVLLGVLKTQSTPGVSCDWMIMEYTHDECCNMLVFVGTYSSPWSCCIGIHAVSSRH
jgi:hypothetical protein